MGYLSLRLTFEVFHNIQEFIVHVWLVGKLHFDLVEIAKSILCKLELAFPQATLHHTKSGMLDPRKLVSRQAQGKLK